MAHPFRPPPHRDFDEQFAELFTRGDRKAICAILDRDEGQFSKELNPEEPAQSIPYRFARELAGYYAANPETGARVWAFFEVFNSRFQTKPSAITTDGLLHDLFGLFQRMTDPGCEAAEKTLLANKAIERLESFKAGLWVQTGEERPASLKAVGK